MRINSDSIYLIFIIMSEDAELKEPWCDEAKWRRNVKTRSDEIIACLNPMELLQYFDSHELVSSYDKEILLLDTKPRQDKVKHILQMLENTDKKGCLHLIHQMP